MASCTIRICMVVFFGVFCHLLEGTRERNFETEIARVLACCVCGIVDGHALC